MRKKFIYQIVLDKLEDFLVLTQQLGHSLSFIYENKKYQVIVHPADILNIRFNDVLDTRKVEIVLKTDIERDGCFEKFFASGAFIEKLFDKRCFIPVSALNLSSRHESLFRALEIEFLGDLISYSEIDLSKFPNYGKKSLQELKEALSSFDLDFFSISIKNWPKFDERRKKGIIFPEVDAEKYKV